jgi:hypothetical protein
MLDIRNAEGAELEQSGRLAAGSKRKQFKTANEPRQIKD